MIATQELMLDSTHTNPALRITRNASSCVANAAQTMRKCSKKNGGRCYYCGRGLIFRGNPRNWVVEHIIPRVEGGPDCLDNFMPSCVPCNLSKGRKALGVFCSANTCIGPERDGLLDEWNDDSPVQAVDGLAEFNRVLVSSEYVCALFYAPWCKPCQIFRPEFNRESKRYGGIKFISVSSDHCRDIYELFWEADETPYFPTVIFFSRNRIHRFLDQFSPELFRKTLREWAPTRTVLRAFTKPLPTAHRHVNNDYEERMTTLSVSVRRMRVCEVIIQRGPNKGTDCGRSRPCPYHDRY